MNVLVTAARFPVALDVIRKLGRSGHRVVAADSLRTAPGEYSRYVAVRARVAAPGRDARRFLLDVLRLVARHRIDLVVPCFEEAFYLARHRERFEPATSLFASPLPLLSRLHDKAGFTALARSLGLRVPDTTLVRSAAELVRAARDHGRYFARPVWSRAGIDLCTNVGPLAGAIDLAQVHPTERAPWIVQAYVDGVDVSASAIAQHGRLVALCTYRHPLEIEHAGGIVFESIDDPEMLSQMCRLVEATGYHGQLGVDFRRGPRGLVALECNPRPTAGLHLISDALFVDAVIAPPPGPPRVVPAGVRRMYASAVVRDGLLHRDHLRSDLAYLLSNASDVYGERGDRLPALVQLLAPLAAARYRLAHGRPDRSGTTLVSAWLDGTVWNGEPIP